MSSETTANRGTVAVGLALVLIGLLFLLVQFVGFNVWSFAWTFFIIGPGLVFFAAMLVGGRAAWPLAIPGSVLTTTGLILLYQATTNLWQSWAYLWALVAPTSVGVGLMIGGARGDRPELVRLGQRLALIGLALLLVGAIFFELVLNFSGLGGTVVARVLGPAVLIGAGLVLLLRGRPWRRSSGDQR